MAGDWPTDTPFQGKCAACGWRTNRHSCPGFTGGRLKNRHTCPRFAESITIDAGVTGR